MNSNQKHFFEQIMISKGFKLKWIQGEAKLKYVLTPKANKQAVEKDQLERVENILFDKEVELNAEDQRFSDEIYKKARLLKLTSKADELTDEDFEAYRGELLNQKALREHLNFSYLISDAQKTTDKLFNDKIYEDYGIQNATGVANKIRVVQKLATALDCNPLEFDVDYKDCWDDEHKVDKQLADEVALAMKLKKENQDVTYVAYHQYLVKCVKSLCSNDLFSKSKIEYKGVDDKRTQINAWTVKSELLHRHLQLLSRRRPEMKGVLKEVLELAHFQVVKKKIKKIV
jgi:hypothetical protein